MDIVKRNGPRSKLYKIIQLQTSKGTDHNIKLTTAEDKATHLCHEQLLQVPLYSEQF